MAETFVPAPDGGPALDGEPALDAEPTPQGHDRTTQAAKQAAQQSSRAAPGNDDRRRLFVCIHVVRFFTWWM